MADVSVIGVVGAGQMGNGIAHVGAIAGLEVHLSDVSQAALDKARATIEKNLGRQVKKERISQADAAAAMERIHMSTDMAALAPAQPHQAVRVRVVRAAGVGAVVEARDLARLQLVRCELAVHRYTAALEHLAPLGDEARSERGRALFMLTRYEAAVESFQKSIERNATWQGNHRYLVAAYGHLGMTDEAEWEMEELRTLGFEPALENWEARSQIQDPAYRARYFDGLRKAGVPEE